MIFEWLSRRIFNTVHRNNLVYNTCWEDPRLDREALQISPSDEVMVITSAGCNALDYALVEPAHVHAVDMNPRQNALLDLKLAAIRSLEFDDFFKMFGQGHLPGIKTLYADRLRGELSGWSQTFWDRKIKWFNNKKRSFYYRGTSGMFARMISRYMRKVQRVQPIVDQMLECETVEQQKVLYDQLYDRFWTSTLKFALNRDTTLSMLGVPKAQRRQIETQYEGGVVKFIQDCIQAVFAEIPLKDNYFWRVYIKGSYTRECCPEYLKEDNFQRLKSGLHEKISTYTDSVQGFLEKHDRPISRFVLLDHMDWLSDHFFPLLESEWQSILERSTPTSRIIWRSGGLKTDFIDKVEIRHNGQLKGVNSLLTYDEPLAEKLHPLDRVHTYASFYIAELNV